MHFVAEAFKHAKAIAVAGAGADLLRAANLPQDAAGVVADGDPAKFIAAIAKHRAWARSEVDLVSA